MSSGHGKKGSGSRCGQSFEKNFGLRITIPNRHRAKCWFARAALAYDVAEGGRNWWFRDDDSQSEGARHTCGSSRPPQDLGAVT